MAWASTLASPTSTRSNRVASVPLETGVRGGCPGLAKHVCPTLKKCPLTYTPRALRARTRQPTWPRPSLPNPPTPHAARAVRQTQLAGAPRRGAMSHSGWPAPAVRTSGPASILACVRARRLRAQLDHAPSHRSAHGIVLHGSFPNPYATNSVAGFGLRVTRLLQRRFVGRTSNDGG